MSGKMVAGFDIGGSKTEVVLLAEGSGKPQIISIPSRGVPCWDPTLPLPYFDDLLDSLPQAPVSAVVNMVGRNKEPLLAALCKRGVKDVAAFREAEGVVPLFAAAAMDCQGVLMAGTGVVLILPRGESFQMIDGWGWNFGDAGSGYWIGRLTLQRTLRRLDMGLEPLLKLPMEPPPRDNAPEWVAFRDCMVDWAYGLSNRQVAAFTADVAALAAEGNDWAMDILSAAAEELLQLLLRGQAISGRPVLLMGGLSRCQPLVDLLQKKCRRRGLSLLTRPSLKLSLAAAVMAAASAGWRLDMDELLMACERGDE